MDARGQLDMSPLNQSRATFLGFSGVLNIDDGATAAARARLRQAPYQALRRIDCRCEEGVLILRGRVPSYYLKQYAQEMVADVNNVRHVTNELEVVAPAQWDVVPPAIRRKESVIKNNA
jgi:osmotically-inducible protein OsmY